MKILYTATATAHGGRDGRVSSDDGCLDLALSVPRDLGGSGGDGGNPEQLFAAGYAACFESAVRYVAHKRDITIKDASVTAQVGIGPHQPDGFALAVKLTVRLPGVDGDTARQLVDTAHDDICPYSHATRGNIDVNIEIA